MNIKDILKQEDVEKITGNIYKGKLRIIFVKKRNKKEEEKWYYRRKTNSFLGIFKKVKPIKNSNCMIVEKENGKYIILELEENKKSREYVKIEEYNEKFLICSLENGMKILLRLEDFLESQEFYSIEGSYERFVNVGLTNPRIRVAKRIFDTETFEVLE